MAYTQTPIARPTYMELPPGVTLKGMGKKTHCLKILNNIYGKKDSGRKWYLYLKSTMINLDYQQSKYEECVFYKGSTIFFTNTDDGVLLDHNKATPQKHLNQLQSASLNFLKAIFYWIFMIPGLIKNSSLNLRISIELR
jgi:hypothetical protein